jgi:hypothetical protein
LIWHDYSDVLNWNMEFKTIGVVIDAALGGENRGLGVLCESTEEVTWRDHGDDAT